MKLWRGLGVRIVAGSALCGVLGLFAARAVIRWTARESIQAGLAAYVRRSFDSAELSRCERSPETWSLALDHGGRLDAYDARTLRSLNPTSQPLDMELYAKLEAGEASPVALLHLGSEHRGMLLRSAATGPCSLIQATWPPRSSRTRNSLYFLLVGMVAVIAVAAALGVIAVVSPLTRRIDRLRAAAGRVGSPDGYVSAGDAQRDELGELSNILDEAHGRIRADALALEDRQKALERYLSDVAHDLRTPIASLQLALEQAANLSTDPVIDELLRASLKDIVYLGGLTENLRLACQLRDGWSPLAGDVRVDLCDVAERVTSRMRYFAKNRRTSLEVARPDGPVIARCHPIAAEQVLNNLVENAISHGDPGGHVAVVLTSQANRFTLAVIDDGPGVLPSELVRLGQRTFRSDEARQRDPGGTGLGLAISTEVCAACGWSVDFEPHDPRGLRVVIRGALLA